jgi:hypothetical protein
VKSFISTLLFVSLLAGSAAGAETRPAASSSTAPAAQAALQPIRYQRSGGFAGTNDVIEITPAGDVVVQGKLMGTGKGKLTADQIKALAPLFKEWDKYQASYPAPRGSADGFELKIRYGTREVAASELNTTVPASYLEVARALEKIAADVKGKE